MDHQSNIGKSFISVPMRHNFQIMFRSPGLVVMGGDSLSRDRIPVMDNLFHLCCKIVCLYVRKRLKLKMKMWPLL